MTDLNDHRPCPGCNRMITDRVEYRYRYPAIETDGGKYVTADQGDVTAGFWRCGACLSRDTRAWRELGRPAGARRPPEALLSGGKRWP